MTAPPARAHAPAAPTPMAPVGATRAWLALLAAVVSALTIAGLARIAVDTASGQRLDQLILSGADGHQGTLAQYAQLAVESVSTPVIAGILVLTIVLALVRRRARILLPLGLLVLGANLTTQIIKHVLVTREALGPGIEITPNSFPSGHTTLAATAMVALVLASGPARVILAPLGALWTTAAGIGTLVVGWHRPSDVVGAIVVAAAWTFLVLALDGFLTRRGALRAARRSGRGRRRAYAELPGAAGEGLGVAGAVVASLLGLAGVVGLAAGAAGLTSLGLPLDLNDTAQQQSAFTAATCLVGGGTAAWMALVLVLRTPISHR